VVSETELEIAKNKLAGANAKVDEALANQESAEHKLSYTQIRAPFHGFINRIPYKIGSLIEEKSLLTSISENNQVFAYFDVSEKEYLRFAENSARDSIGSKTVDLLLATGKMHTAPGRIETIESEVEASTGNIAFRARFDNPNKVLKHGASGKVRMTKRFINVLAIPQKATFEIQDKLYVYVLKPDNSLEMRSIGASNRLSHIFLVDSGLKDKEKIVYEGLQNVRAGVKIQPRFVAMAEIIKTLSTK
jgi:membrane fusion protein (multidrug efflux system)